MSGSVLQLTRLNRENKAEKLAFYQILLLHYVWENIYVVLRVPFTDCTSNRTVLNITLRGNKVIIPI